jgi:two-component system, OmpR family, phosphate regulon response regulator PhoB
MSKQNIRLSVLVVEDDEAIVTLLKYNIEKAGYIFRCTGNGDEALIMIDEERPDIILLDWMLPGISGIEVCKRLKNDEDNAHIPIIMLSARGEENDKIEGLERGVDDYLVKPFSPKELMARINAVLRRIRPAFSAKELVYGDIKMDLVGHAVKYNGQILKIGPIEYRLLQSFMEHPKRVLSREQLIRRVWGDSFDVEPRTVDVHINRLRKVLKDGAVIRTIRSAGYCMQDNDLECSEVIAVNDSEIIGFQDGF